MTMGGGYLAGFRGFSPATTMGGARCRGGRWRRFLGLRRIRSTAVLIALLFCATPWPCAAQEPTFSIKDVDDAQAKKFKTEFLSRKKALEDYLTSTRFAPVFTGKIDVEVFSKGPQFSESLLFAWDGRRGHMYFPAERLEEGRAAITHELTHVNAPNEVRFLGEGFPTYLEEKMGNIKAYPLLNDHIECGIANYEDNFKKPVQRVDLVRFDGVPTKRGVFLGDDIGLEPAFPKSKNGVDRRRAFSYLVSASFVKFLVESQGLDRFKALYDLTPLTPHKAAKADPARYQQSLGKPLSELQSNWLTWLRGKQKSCS
jgi:hypothetical protein